MAADEDSGGRAAAGAGASVDPRVERTRRAVLAATADLLVERGFEGLSTEEIATRSGVARSTIYRNWPDRAELLIEAVQQHMEPVADPDTGDLRRDLIAVFGVLARALDPATPLGRMLPSLLSAAERDPDLRRLHREAAAQRRQLAEQVLRRGIDRGRLPADVDAAAAATTVTATLYYRRLISGEALDERAVADLVDALLTGLTRRADP